MGSWRAAPRIPTRFVSGQILAALHLKILFFVCRKIIGYSELEIILINFSNMSFYLCINLINNDV